MSELWSRFAAVASQNPNAWSRVAYSPDDIRTISADNRAVCFPYPKRMCANIDVDQGAAVLLCSYESARAAGLKTVAVAPPHGRGPTGDADLFVSGLAALRVTDLQQLAAE